MSRRKQLKKLEKQTANRKKNKTVLRPKLTLVTILIVLVIVSIIISTSGEKIVKATSIAFEDSKLASEIDSEKVNMVKSSDGKMVPVPKGYSASQIEGETSVNRGFVIYEGDIDWNSVLNASTKEISIETANKEIQTQKSEEQNTVGQTGNTNSPINEEENAQNAPNETQIDKDESENTNESIEEKSVNKDIEQTENNSELKEEQSELEEPKQSEDINDTSENPAEVYAETAVGNYSITKGGNTKYYTTLTDALAEATSGDTIKLENDAIESAEITITKNVSLDIGTFILSTNTITINSEAKLDIKGTGKIKNLLIGHTIINNGTLELSTEATIENEVTESDENVEFSAVCNNGIFNMTNGNIIATYRGIIQIDGGTTNMSNGTIKVTGPEYVVYAIKVFSDLADSPAIVKITGGNITGKRYGISAHGTQTYLYIGDENETEITKETPVIIGKDFAICREWVTSANIFFYNGILKGRSEGCQFGPTEIRDGCKITEGEEIIDGKTHQTQYLEKIEESVTGQDVAVFNLQKTVNQYVWVPVENVNDLYGIDKSGKYIGKLYKNYGNKIEREKENWEYEIGSSLLIKWKSLMGENSYREPSIMSERHTDMYLASYLTGHTEGEFLAEQMEENFYKMIKSIEKYKGFYIGRYETGNLINNLENAVVRKMDSNIANLTWYKMYEKCINLRGTNENVTTSMIWGTLYDETLNWLVNSEAINSKRETIDNSLITTKDSKKWGNYRDTTFNYIMEDSDKPVARAFKGVDPDGTRIPAGSSEYTKVNNIYDLAGNTREWTLEEYTKNRMVSRGAHYANIAGDTRGANCRDDRSPQDSKSDCGCRAILLIN